MCKNTKLACFIREENAWRFPMSTGLLGFCLGMSCFGVAMKLLEYENSPSLPPKLVGIPVSIMKKIDSYLLSCEEMKLIILYDRVYRCSVKLNVFRVQLPILHLVFLTLKMLGTAESKYLCLWENLVQKNPFCHQGRFSLQFVRLDRSRSKHIMLLE